MKLPFKLQEAQSSIVARYEELSQVGVDCKRLSSEKCHFYDLTETMHGIIGMVSATLITFSVYFMETQSKLLAAQLNALRKYRMLHDYFASLMRMSRLSILVVLA